jgi:hypothetical protein
VVVLEVLANPHELALIRVDAAAERRLFVGDAVEGEGVDDHVACEGVGEVVGAGVVVILYFVLAQQPSILLLVVLGLVRSQVEQLQYLGPFDFVYFVACVRGGVRPILAMGSLSRM